MPILDGGKNTDWIARQTPFGEDTGMLQYFHCVKKIGPVLDILGPLQNTDAVWIYF